MSFAEFTLPDGRKTWLRTKMIAGVTEAEPPHPDESTLDGYTQPKTYVTLIGDHSEAEPICLIETPDFVLRCIPEDE